MKERKQSPECPGGELMVTSQQGCWQEAELCTYSSDQKFLCRGGLIGFICCDIS